MFIAYLILNLDTSIFNFKSRYFNTKISEIENIITTDDDHDKYITTQEFTAISAQAKLATTRYIYPFIKGSVLNKNELNELSKKLHQYQQKD